MRPTLSLSSPRAGSQRVQMPEMPGGGAQSLARHSVSIVSDTLFGDASEICIHHMGSDYRLRITRQDKLILTK